MNSVEFFSKICFFFVLFFSKLFFFCLIFLDSVSFFLFNGQIKLY